jgi:pyruvate dehydrogenase E2 component (dihydrolipoamide acetyltransferase)
VALAARSVPEMNGHLDGASRPADAVHAGVAVSLRGGGLIASAIRDAQALRIDDLMAAMRDVVARARTGRLRSSEMTDGTITVSSMGEGSVADTYIGMIFANTRTITEALGGELPPLPAALADWAEEWGLPSA